MSASDREDNEERVELYRGVFDMFDTDGSGLLSPDELQEACEKLGVKLNAREICNILKLVDADGNEEVDFMEFVSLMEQMETKAVDKDAELRQAFQTFDEDGSGFIDVAELRSVMEKINGVPMSETEAKAMIGVLDENNDGKVSFEEFVTSMKP